MYAMSCFGPLCVTLASPAGWFSKGWDPLFLFPFLVRPPLLPFASFQQPIVIHSDNDRDIEKKHNCCRKANNNLVGGFNPFENSQNGNLPQIGVKIKNN